MTKRLILCLSLGVLFCANCLAQAKEFDRGYDLKSPSAIIAPKGAWTIGGNLGFGISKQDNYDFLMIKGITANSYFVLASPQFCYFIADNMGVGVRFNYKRNYLLLDSASAAIGETKINIKNYYLLRHQYQGAFFYRYYLPFGKSGRFAGFADAELGFGGTTTNVIDNESRGGYGQGLTASVGAYVGALALLTSHLGIDVRLGLLEFNYSTLNQQNNVGSATEQYRVNGTAKSIGGNFMIDLLSLSFGVHYYL